MRLQSVVILIALGMIPGKTINSAVLGKVNSPEPQRSTISPRQRAADQVEAQLFEIPFSELLVSVSAYSEVQVQVSQCNCRARTNANDLRSISIRGPGV